MDYEEDFEKSFMRRTLEIAENGRNEPYDATILVNCLLGLLIVPRESFFKNIPDVSYKQLGDWGIKPSSIVQFSKCEYGVKHEPTLKQLVRHMRNAVAHFNIRPFSKHGYVDGFVFSDRSGFKAKVSLGELQKFVTILSRHMHEQE